MAELLKSGAVFLHVPKCGGSWVCDVLRQQKLVAGRVGYPHSTTERINNIMRYHGWQFIRRWPLRPWLSPSALRSAFKFCFVRNPLAWYESWWKFTAGGKTVWEPDRWHPQRSIDECASDNFNTFLRNVLRTRPGYVTEMYSWYTDGVDFVGRSERLADDLIRALHEAGVEFDETPVRSQPRVNVSEARRGRPQWEPDVLNQVVEAEAEGIERYGYGRDVQEFCASAAQNAGSVEAEACVQA